MSPRVWPPRPRPGGGGCFGKSDEGGAEAVSPRALRMTGCRGGGISGSLSCSFLGKHAVCRHCAFSGWG